MSEANIYDIAVVGAGAAGSIASIRAAQLGKKVVLVERNQAICRKVLLTGKGRCNITNAADINIFIEKFGEGGKFLRTSFFKFFNQDLLDFFEAKGLTLKTERQGRIFPETDKAASVVEVLQLYLAETGVEIIYNMRVSNISKRGNYFAVEAEDGREIESRKVMLATGGASYKATGSCGDGYRIAKSLGHKIMPLQPGLVPLKVKEGWIKSLQGIALENVRLVFRYGSGNKIISDVGEVMLTHFGISGPLILDLSWDIVSIIEKTGDVKLFIDLKPGLRAEQLKSKLLHKFKTKGNVQLKNIMRDLLPMRLIPVFLEVADLQPEIKTNQITQRERKRIIDCLKGFPMTLTGALPIEEAMVTAGGVSREEINPRTMESKIVAGLYFAGEIIEGAAPSGGYNLQQAFSTGYLAGERASDA